MTTAELETWLRETNPARLETLWARADATRQAHVGDAVHLRALVEVSSHCTRRCAYCGLRAERRNLPRYRMTAAEILAAARQAAATGYGTVVLQSGEDPVLDADRLANLIQTIKTETPLAVTLSLGERRAEELAAWRAAGADRYLLRFETGDETLYEAIHPDRSGRAGERLALLATLRNLGYEIGSGVLIGLPGQSYTSLARDIARFAELDLDMVGVGPFIAHPATPLGRGEGPAPLPAHHQVPNTEAMAYKVVALTRLVCPEANLPSTTALASLNPAQGRELGLQRGANVIMPNLTPRSYRALYEIYPAKACLGETAQEGRTGMEARIRAVGRTVGRGPGGRRRSATGHGA